MGFAPNEKKITPKSYVHERCESFLPRHLKTILDNLDTAGICFAIMWSQQSYFRRFCMGSWKDPSIYELFEITL